MRILNDLIMNEAAATADKYSEVVDLGFIQDVALQIIWTSTTCAGSIVTQASNDGLNWVDIAGVANSYGVVVSSITKTVNDNNVNTMVILSDANYKYLRVFFDFTSGSLTSLKVLIHGKGV